MSNEIPYVLIITGPTGSGKTSISLELSKSFPIEIINVDVGQFYSKLSVGTAKPNWRNQSVPHHCFDIVDKPINFNVSDFRKIILNKINSVWSKKKLPVLVGGSLFYIKSLLYPPVSVKKPSSKILNVYKDDGSGPLWDQLNAIDSKRAFQLHRNDTYRIQRALNIWVQTGRVPSDVMPQLIPEFNCSIFFIDLPRESLYKKINNRTVDMIQNLGWLDEADKLYDSDWKSFLEFKRLIGYPEIFKWIEQGKKTEQLKKLISEVQMQTRRYAKRQVSFWKYMVKVLEKNSVENLKKLDFSINVFNLDNLSVDLICKQVDKDMFHLYGKKL